MTESGDQQALPAEIRSALDLYRNEQTPARWTALSQLWIGEIDVLDALQKVNPEFPDPLALPVDGLLEDSSEFFQWPVLPKPDDVLAALLAALKK